MSDNAKLSFGQMLGIVLLILVVIFIGGYFIACHQFEKHDIDIKTSLSDAGNAVREKVSEAKRAGEKAISNTEEIVEVDIKEVLPESEDFEGANNEVSEFFTD